MNLIANRHLDGAQKQVIYELTLKKRQSKKSTMSDRQRAAKQQLAKELMLERKIPPSLGSISSQHTIDSIAAISNTSTADSMSHADQQSLLNELLPHNNITSNDSSSPPQSAATCPLCCCNRTQLSSTTTTNTSSQHQPQLNGLPPSASLATDATTATVAVADSSSRLSCASCSFTRSDSSYSGSSASVVTSASSGGSNIQAKHVDICNHTHHLMIENNQLLDTTNTTDDDGDPFREARKKDATIKVHKLKLEHLNYELERRLHQYECLVAQEKALLGTYNMMLFTNQGVNNFHLHRDIAQR